MINTLGHIGAFLLAICALPQTIQSIKNGHSKGLSLMFLWSWFGGELLMLTYVVAIHGPKGPLFLNYALNSALLLFIVYYRHFPRKQNG